jgi:hypothetical protein
LLERSPLNGIDNKRPEYLGKDASDDQPSEDLASEELPPIVLDILANLTTSPQARADFTPWELEGLYAHNYYRQWHGSPPLQLHRTVTKTLTREPLLKRKPQYH